MMHIRYLSALLAIFLVGVSLPLTSNARDVDLVINHGRVIDPDSKLDDVWHLGIKDGTITRVSEQPLDGGKVIDAKGLIVAPGFIDFHAHGQNTAPDRMQAFDGVGLLLKSGPWFMKVSRPVWAKETMMTTKRRKRHTPEQIVRKLRDAETMLNAGKDQAAVLQALEVSKATYLRWRNGHRP